LPHHFRIKVANLVRNMHATICTKTGIMVTKPTVRILRLPHHFRLEYENLLKELRANPRRFKVFKALYFEVGDHPSGMIDFECSFAAHHISRLHPETILDIGSYRHFILGLLAHYSVTSIDVRSRRPMCSNETVITCDAKKILLPGNSFDVATSLCSIEHFGLGRYGDEFDPDADKKAFSEMIRVLKSNGRMIFSTSITRGQPYIAFNMHRVYSHEMLRALCANLECEDERFYSHEKRSFCKPEEVTNKPDQWDVYCGCWRKSI